MVLIKYWKTYYIFNRPTLMSEDEFFYYKQVILDKQTVNLFPEDNIWKEFGLEKWSLISIAIGFSLASLSKSLEFIGAICAVLLMAIIYNTLLTNDIFRYFRYRIVKKKFYKKLKRAVETSINYEEFKIKEKEIKFKIMKK